VTTIDTDGTGCAGLAGLQRHPVAHWGLNSSPTTNSYMTGTSGSGAENEHIRGLPGMFRWHRGRGLWGTTNSKEER